MLRTNAKIARDRVKSYVLDNLTEDFDTFEDAARFIWSDFERCTRGDAHYKRMNRQAAFLDWSRGLPLDGLFTCWLYYGENEPVRVLGDILEETEAERARFTSEQAAEKLVGLIYSEVVKAL